MRTTETWRTTETCPPRTIFDFLHKCERAGIEIPEDIDEWWFEETCKEQEEVDNGN